MRILGIYDADGTVAGEARYLMKKAMGRSSCALCDLTHGWNPFGKGSWRKLKSTEPRIEWLHRNEIPEQILSGIIEEIPCIAVEENGNIRPLVNKQEIKALAGDLHKLEQLLKERTRALQINNNPAACGEGA